MSSVDINKLKDPLDFLNYCDKANVVYPNRYPEKPEDYLEQIHKEVSKLLPDLVFTDFKFQIVNDNSISVNDCKFYWFVISIKSHGKTYKQKSFYRLYSVSKKEYFGKKIDQQEFYKIFNKILSDMQSSYRLHEVKGYQENAVDWERFGIIALKKEQVEMFRRGGVFFTPSYEIFKNSITSTRIKLAISEYQKIGLLSHLSADQIKLAIVKASEQENRNLNDVVKCFPRTLLYFDTELGNLQDPYAELLNELSEISKGEFKPTKILDNFSKPVKNNALVKFTINEKEYFKQLKVDGDWIDPGFSISSNKL